MDMQVSYTHLRQNLSSILDKVEEDSLVCAIERRGHEPSVIMSKADYDSWMETMYLMSSPENHKRLLKSMKELDEGKVHKYDLSTSKFVD